MGIASVLYVALAPTHVGQLMIDSIVHTMTIAGLNEPAVPGACLARFEEIFAAARDERIQYGALVPATVYSCVKLGVGIICDNKTMVGKPELGRWYGGEGVAQVWKRVLLVGDVMAQEPT